MQFRNFKMVSFVVYGRGAFNQLDEILSPRRLNDKPFIFLVDHFFEGKPLLNHIPLRGKDKVVLVDVTYEPKTTQVDKLAQQLKDEFGTISGVIGIGGGSAMDLAKAVSLMMTNPGSAADYQGWDLVKQPGVYKAGIPTLIIKKERFITGDNYLPELKKHQIDFIVLAGFLWKLPVQLIQAYPKKVINIHPALLPKYGGKGMFGSKVHESVIANKEKESGITIHYVDELYDHGEIILQSKCLVDDDDTPDTLAQKIHALEHTHYPAVINDLIKKQNRS